MCSHLLSTHLWGLNYAYPVFSLCKTQKLKTLIILHPNLLARWTVGRRRMYIVLSRAECLLFYFSKHRELWEKEMTRINTKFCLYSGWLFHLLITGLMNWTMNSWCHSLGSGMLENGLRFGEAGISWTQHEMGNKYKVDENYTFSVRFRNWDNWMRVQAVIYLWWY